MLEFGILTTGEVRAAPDLKLSQRLEAVLRLLSPCRSLADVGTDHALLPIAAVQRGIAERALAVDLREEPLRGARRNIERAGLRDRVSILRGDGAIALSGRGVDALVLAGLSGRSIQRACSAAPDVLGSLNQLVVQPNQDAQAVRQWAHEVGLHLRDETLIEEHDRTFVVCAFVPGADKDPAYERAPCPPEISYRVGPLLLMRKDPLAFRYCEAQCERLSAFSSAAGPEVALELAAYRVAREALR